ncbi:364_t:CDS:2, partial [Acaulospora morrowiae]
MNSAYLLFLLLHFSALSFALSIQDDFASDKKIVRMQIKHRHKRGSIYVKSRKLTIDTDYLASVEVGTPGQSLNFLIDSGSPEMWMTSSLCDSSCSTSDAYFDPSKSSTFLSNNTEWIMTYAGGQSVSGIFGKDVVNIGGIHVIDQTIGLLVNSDIDLTFDGIMGVGRSVDSDYGTLTPFDNMIAQQLISEPLYTARFVKVPDDDNGGEFIFGAIDYSKVLGDITYSPITENNHWQINCSGLYLGQESLTPGDNYTSFCALDTGSPGLLLYSHLADAIHSRIPGAGYYDTDETRDGSAVIYTVPCDTDNSLGPLVYEIESRKFSIPISDIVGDPIEGDEDNCLSSIGGNSDPGTAWILGSLFMERYLIIYNQGTEPPTVGIAYRTDVDYN